MARGRNAVDPPVGATGVGKRRKGVGRRLIPLLILTLVAALLVFGLSRCGSGDDAATTGGSAPSPAPTSTPTSSPSTDDDAEATGGSAAGAGAGSVVAQGTTLLPSAGEGATGVDLATHTGQEARAEAVAVESVPTDEGFWVGTAATDRLWVQLTGEAGESPFQVKAGDKVSFVGTVAKNPEAFPEEIGLTAAEGAQMLTTQGQHLAVDRSALALAR